MILVAFLSYVAILAAADAGDVSSFIGTWRGDSTCLASDTACRDEVVVYRIAVQAGKAGNTTVSADKIVDGRAINMGTLEFQYDRKQQALVCEYAQGVWRLKVDGEKLEGTLTRPDRKLFRRVTLRKQQ